MLGDLEGGGDTREVADFAAACLGVESLHVAPFALFQRGADVDLIKVLLADDARCHAAQLVRRADEGCQGDDAGVDKELADLGDAADVLDPVFRREAEVAVDARADVVAVEDAAEQAALTMIASSTRRLKEIT